MTTIKGKTDRTLDVELLDSGRAYLRIADPSDFMGINVPTAELAAALGLVPREELAARDEAIDIWRAKLHDAGNAWAKEYAEARKAEAEAKALRAELDEAEATIARVRHLRDVSGDTVGVEELDAALDPRPAFVLPTEVPARIWADDKLGNEHTFTLFADGNGGSTWLHDCAGADADDDEFYSGVRLMQEFTGHTLIGAES